MVKETQQKGGLKRKLTMIAFKKAKEEEERKKKQQQEMIEKIKVSIPDTVN